MKKFKKIAFLVLIVIIVILSLSIYASANKDNSVDQKNKVFSEVKFIEGKIVNLLNSMNNIKFESYSISVSDISKDSKTQEKSEAESGSSKQESSQESSGEGNSQGGGQGSSEGGQSSDSSSSTSSSGQDAEKYELKSNGILTGEQTIDWEKVKTDAESLYTYSTTITLDMYQLNLNQEDILNFNKEYDNLTIACKDENKENTLTTLATMYEYIPKFARGSTDDEIYVDSLEVKSEVFKAYSILDKDDWEKIGENIKSAVNLYSKILSNASIDPDKQYTVNKGYVMINELQNAVNVKDKDVFLIKYKNLMQELNNL